MASTKRTTVPVADTPLLNWALNASSFITPSPTTYGLTAAIATSLSGAITVYQDALAACNPFQRNKTAVIAKNEAKYSLLTICRDIVKLAEGAAAVTDEARSEIGIPPRKTPSPIGIPTEIPQLDIVSVNGRTVIVRIHGDDENRRGKPAGVAGAQVYSFVGTTPPEDPEEWTFQGSITALNHIPVEFPLSVAAGSQVWFKACFFNPRNQCGAPSAATPTYLQYGSSSMAA